MGSNHPKTCWVFIYSWHHPPPLTTSSTSRKPLIQLTQKNTLFLWTPVAHNAFDALKETFLSAPVLVHPDPTRRLRLCHWHCPIPAWWRWHPPSGRLLLPKVYNPGNQLSGLRQRACNYHLSLHWMETLFGWGSTSYSGTDRSQESHLFYHKTYVESEASSLVIFSRRLRLQNLVSTRHSTWHIYLINWLREKSQCWFFHLTICRITPINPKCSPNNQLTTNIFMLPST